MVWMRRICDTLSTTTVCICTAGANGLAPFSTRGARTSLLSSYAILNLW